MSIEGIILYTTRAMLFALGAGMAYFLLRLILLKRKGKTFHLRNEVPGLLLVLYLAALFQITTIRGGIKWDILLSHGRPWRSWQLLPLWNTFMELKTSLWAFLYPVLGNITWFIPLGAILPFVGRRTDIWQLRRILLAALAASLTIETLQWFLDTGVSDIDDILFNLAGALLGYGVYKMIEKCRNQGEKYLK